MTRPPSWPSMGAWARHLNERVVVHLSNGPTIEGRLVYARREKLKLQDAVLVLGADERQDLEGVVVVPEFEIVFGQALGLVSSVAKPVTAEKE